MIFSLDSSFLQFTQLQARAALSNDRASRYGENEIIVLEIAAGKLAAAENRLIGQNAYLLQTSEGLRLLGYLRLRQNDKNGLKGLVESKPNQEQMGLPFYWFLKQQLLLSFNYVEEVIGLGLPLNQQDIHAWHLLNLARAAAWTNNVELASRQIELLPEDFVPLELVEYNIQRLVAAGEYAKALVELEPLLKQPNPSVFAWEFAVHVQQRLGNTKGALTMLHRANVLNPKNNRLLDRLVADGVCNRLPVISRRYSLLSRLYIGSEQHPVDQKRCDDNLLFSYENGGRADFLPLHHSCLKSIRSDSTSAGNYALQMASLADPSSGSFLEQAAALIHRYPGYVKRQSAHQKPNHRLKVGFISPDLNYHPCGRFLAMMLSASLGEGGDCHVVSIGDRRDSTSRVIADIAREKATFHDLKQFPLAKSIDYLRDLNLDVAVDLAGWTAGGGVQLFASRIAPVQINYLGFFATTGIPEMDYWLGDQSLFPASNQEVHLEQIWTLPRCFLAWKPPASLPEGREPVQAGPTSPNIVFGSFNHVRKLGESTLRLWGLILQAIPGSRLALKAYTSDDPGTVVLLRRRMRRCGLDPENVIWLPTPPDPADHLRQYGLVDVALDPFPNGGCTTTCEALWMGVPVITLAGNRYVSRMSTAVLAGAHLSQWVAANEQDYLNKAVEAADQLSHLRSSRQQLREHVKKSPLGDVAGLNSALWQAFAGMAQRTSTSGD